MLYNPLPVSMLAKFLFLIFPNCVNVQHHHVTILNRTVQTKDTVEITYFDENHNETVEIPKERYDLYYEAYALMCEDV